MNKKEYIKIKSQLYRNMHKIKHFVSKVKYEENRGKQNSIFELINQKSLPGSKYIDGNILPSSIEELGKNLYIPFVRNKISLEWLWQYRLINKYSSNILKYIEYKEEYEKYILSGNYEKALEIIEKINGEVCISLWGISQMFLIYELKDGVKEQKKFLQELSEKASNSIVLFTLEFLSFKAEVQNSYESLNYKIEKKYANKKATFEKEILEDFLNFLLDVKYIEFNSEKISKVLSLINTMSIIDIYEAYVKSIQLAISNNLDVNLQTQLSQQIGEVNLIIKDFRLTKCIDFISNDKVEINKNEYVFLTRIIDEYTAGNYNAALKLIEENNLLNMNEFSIYDIYVKSYIFSDLEYEYNKKKKCFCNEIIRIMMSLYKREDLKRNTQAIVNIALLLSDINISKDILNFSMQFVKEKQIQREILAQLSDKYYTPKSLEVYKNRKNDIIECFLENNLFNLTLQVFNNDGKNSNNVDLLRQEYYIAESLMEVDASKSVNIFEKLYEQVIKCKINGKRLYYLAKICEKLYMLYLSMGEYNKALHVIVESYFINDNLIINIDLENLYKIISSCKEESLKNNIETVIFVYIINSKDYFELYKALANYTEANGCFIFSELLNNENLVQNKKQFYFVLSNIYTLDVIKQFVFINKDERINERVKIIRYLIENNYNKAQLENELNNLIKEESLKENIKEVDKSRIVVDNKGILQDLDELYREKYKRFIELKDLNVQIFYVDIDGNNDELDLSISNIKERQEQSFLLFKEILQEYINELLFNPNYGLDKFLSSRIRHGMLKDYLSKPFKNHNILNSKKDSKSSEYLINQFVEENYSDCEDKSKHKILKLLSYFSEKIMSKINDVENWIRIKSQEDKDGLFNYELFEDNAYIYNLYNKSKDINDYNSFFDTLTDEFWKLTETNLKIIRDKIDIELYNYFRHQLKELENNLRMLKNDLHIGILDDLVGEVGVCCSILKQDLELVKNWFHIKKDNQYIDFKFQDLLNTCIEINNKLNNNYSKIKDRIEINVQIPLIFKGDKFTYWVDIINILYLNAIKHCGFQRIDDIKIELEAKVINDITKYNREKKTEYNDLIKVQLDKKYIFLKLKNNLSNEINEEEVANKVDDIFTNIKSCTYENYITCEGGSGIYKMTNILKNNIKTNSFYQFYCLEHEFCIEIFIELKDTFIVGGF
ncbi:hypothetical protein CNEO3_470028 [Clostridium neonatale]|uniref:hypothetical protein n=1 Tax=Clostridium neonatale TaxID=137838 RepID=UPI00291BB3EF|nr:hypothetical protein CNEO3_470028 [Clostridium neonatale]